MSASASVPPVDSTVILRDPSWSELVCSVGLSTTSIYIRWRSGSSFLDTFVARFKLWVRFTFKGRCPSCRGFVFRGSV